MRDARIDADFTVRFVHRLRFTRNAFASSNPVLADLVREGGNLPAKFVVFVDESVALAFPGLSESLEIYAGVHADTMTLAHPVELVPGGEPSKNNQHRIESMLRVMESAGLCRQSYVAVIGGGAVLDAVGLAAAIAHRGVRLIRFPTTTLSQCDSGVGVKNGINAFGKKNYIGSFGVPWGVVNDEAFLVSLSDRDWRCGFAEAVKVALIKDRVLFEHIVARVDAVRRREYDAVTPILRRSAELHLSHIASGGDPFETTTARPLDFGHWAAHKLEAMTDFRLRHGEAVAIGMALDVVYAMRIGLLDPASARAVLDCLEGLGFRTWDPALEHSATLLRGIEDFREHLGACLTICMIPEIGRSVDVHAMDESIVRESICDLARRHATATRREMGSGREGCASGGLVSFAPGNLAP